MTTDLSWKRGSAPEETLRDAVPRRLALTATAVHRSGEGQLLLVDPHPPTTWDTWMLPYASLILDDDQVRGSAPSADFARLTSGSSVAALEHALDQLVTIFADNYRDSVESGTNNVLAHFGNILDGEPLFTSYSLKFSHTSNSYTAYRFEYFAFRLRDLQIQIPHVWIQPADLLELKGDERLDGRKISSNLFEVAAELCGAA